MPYSSYIYGNIHKKNGIFTDEDVESITKCYRPFHFDYVFILKASKDETEKRVSKRNSDAKEGKIKGQLDVEISDFSYLDSHITAFYSIIDGFLQKYFPEAKVIELEVPDILSSEYTNMLKKVYNEIK